MTVTGRYYLFAADGLHRLSKRVLEGLINLNPRVGLIRLLNKWLIL